MNEITITDISDKIATWREEARKRVAEFRSKPHVHRPSYTRKDKGK